MVVVVVVLKSSELPAVGRASAALTLAAPASSELEAVVKLREAAAGAATMMRDEPLRALRSSGAAICGGAGASAQRTGAPH